MLPHGRKAVWRFFIGVPWALENPFCRKIYDSCSLAKNSSRLVVRWYLQNPRQIVIDQLRSELKKTKSLYVSRKSRWFNFCYGVRRRAAGLKLLEDLFLMIPLKKYGRKNLLLMQLQPSPKVQKDYFNQNNLARRCWFKRRTFFVFGIFAALVASGPITQTNSFSQKFNRF